MQDIVGSSNLALGLSAEIPVKAQEVRLKSWGEPRLQAIDWGKAASVKLGNVWFASVLAYNQLQVEAAAALSRIEALSLR